MTSRADATLALALGGLWAVAICIVLYGASVLVIDWIPPLAGPLVTWVVLGLLFALAIAPALIEMTATIRFVRRTGGVTAERCAARLRRLGLTTWMVASWAAWPPHRGSGLALIDELVSLLPGHVWLVAKARDDEIAALLRQRDFVPQPGHDLLCVRPADGATVPCVVPPPRRPRPPATGTDG